MGKCRLNMNGYCKMFGRGERCEECSEYQEEEEE
jgi:hypothetical protein